MRIQWLWAWLALALTGLVGCGAMDEVQELEEPGALEEQELGGGDTPGFEYFEDFEGGVGSEWSPARTHVTPVGGRRFLGEFGVEEVTLGLKKLPRHDTVTVSFDLFVLMMPRSSPSSPRPTHSATRWGTTRA